MCWLMYHGDARAQSAHVLTADDIHCSRHAEPRDNQWLTVMHNNQTNDEK